MKKIYVTFAISLFYACTLNSPMKSWLVIMVAFFVCSVWSAFVMEKRERDGKM